jgi:1-acyl-sn-glycerol-3-phosphate acyltransferase
MIILRSFLFNVLFYLNLMAWMILIIPTFLMPNRILKRVAKAWARSSIWLMRVVAGIKIEYRGRENIPTGGLIVASKHQSMWETFALYPELADSGYILKRELMWIPFFGWYVWKADMVPVNRGARAAALADMNKRASAMLKAGRQIILFPEGTRRPVDAPPRYKRGVSTLYEAANAPILPVALNAGLYWPRRKFLRQPGTMIVEFLPIIPVGLSGEEALRTLEERIESATNRIVAESRARDNLPKHAAKKPE